MISLKGYFDVRDKIYIYTQKSDTCKSIATADTWDRPHSNAELSILLLTLFTKEVEPITLRDKLNSYEKTYVKEGADILDLRRLIVLDPGADGCRVAEEED